jgi:ACS family hexuronate transporter-like MFS transporter
LANAEVRPNAVTDTTLPEATRWAWGLCWLMFACTVLNYMDRQALTVVGPQVKREFGRGGVPLDNASFGWVIAAFQLTYAFCQWPAGHLADRTSVRRAYAVAVTWWSLAGMATAFAPTLGALLICRALLGFGESFNWPCALRVTSNVLPPSDRSLGNGIFNSGAAVGAVLTPLIVVPMAASLGWRRPFLVLGACGLVWVVAWLVFTTGRGRAFLIRGRGHRLAARGGLTAPARWAVLGLVVLAPALAIVGFRATSGSWLGLPVLWWTIAGWMVGLLVLTAALPVSWLQGSDWASSLGQLARRRRFWVMVAVGCTVNVTWHFLVNWMGVFFQEGRKLGPLVGGIVLAVPFLAADAGNLAGGAAVRGLVRRGRSATSARKLVLVGCMALIACAIGVGLVVATSPRTAAPSGAAEPSGVAEVLRAVGSAVRDDAAVVVLLSLTVFGTAAYMVNYFAFGQDVAPEHTGLVIGYLGGLGNLFAAGFMPVAGWISDRYGFAPNFGIVGLLPLAGLITLLVFWGNEDAKSGPHAESLS